MAEFWTSYIWPLTVMLAQSVSPDRRPAGRDRLRAARRPKDLGRGADPPRAQRGRPVRPAAVLRRPDQVRAQGADHPGRREQGRVPARADRHRRAGARRLGGDPGQSRLGDRGHQRRRSLHLRDLLAHGLRHHHGGLGVELEIPVPRRAPLGRADGLLRGLDRLRDHHGAAVCGLAQPHRHRRGAGQPLGPVRLVLAVAVPDVRRVLRLGARRDQPAAVRPGRGRIRARGRLRGGILVHAVPAVLPRRIRRHRHHVRDDDHHVPGRLAAAVPGGAVHLGARDRLVPAQDASSCSSCSPW